MAINIAYMKQDCANSLKFVMDTLPCIAVMEMINICDASPNA